MALEGRQPVGLSTPMVTTLWASWYHWCCPTPQRPDGQAHDTCHFLPGVLPMTSARPFWAHSPSWFLKFASSAPCQCGIRVPKIIPHVDAYGLVCFRAGFSWSLRLLFWGRHRGVDWSTARSCGAGDNRRFINKHSCPDCGHPHKRLLHDIEEGGRSKGRYWPGKMGHVK